MPAFGDRLMDDEIWNVLAFIQSRWSERVRARHDQFEQQLAEQRRSK
jgi:mono/diheme cytochrome c family protein